MPTSRPVERVARRFAANATPKQWGCNPGDQINEGTGERGTPVMHHRCFADVPSLSNFATVKRDFPNELRV